MGSIVRSSTGSRSARFSRVLRRAVAVAAPVMLWGCGSGVGKVVNPINTGGSLKIEISRAAAPSFSWQSGVTAQAISVSNFGPTGAVDRILWGYRNVSITPPITYGVEIGGGVKLGVGEAPPLQSGARYRVEIVVGGQASFADWIVP